jgi:hypothetical protein
MNLDEYYLFFVGCSYIEFILNYEFFIDYIKLNKITPITIRLQLLTILYTVKLF